MRKSLLMMMLLVCAANGTQICAMQKASNQDQKAAAPSEKVDINHASMDELMKVRGLTRVWADRIVRYRPYRGKNQLLLDGIVPSGVYQQIKDYVVAHRQPH